MGIFAKISEEHFKDGLKELEICICALIVILYIKQHGKPVDTWELKEAIKMWRGKEIDNDIFYPLIKKLENKGYIQVKRNRGLFNYYIPTEKAGIKRQSIDKTPIQIQQNQNPKTIPNPRANQPREIQQGQNIPRLGTIPTTQNQEPVLIGEAIKKMFPNLPTQQQNNIPTTQQNIPTTQNRKSVYQSVRTSSLINKNAFENFLEAKGYKEGIDFIIEEEHDGLFYVFKSLNESLDLHKEVEEEWNKKEILITEKDCNNFNELLREGGYKENIDYEIKELHHPKYGHYFIFKPLIQNLNLKVLAENYKINYLTSPF